MAEDPSILVVYLPPADDGARGKSALDPRDPAALEKSVNDASVRTAALWVSFLTLIIYLVISVGTVTHMMLLLEQPIKLPLFNVELSLIGFFFVAPLLILAHHAYLLLQLSTLSAKAKMFGDTLRDAGLSEEGRAAIVSRIDQSPVARLSDRGGSHLTRAVTTTMQFATLLIPVAALLMIQIAFLPYHHEWLTWMHRAVIATDILLLWSLWPADLTVDRPVRKHSVLLRSIGKLSAVLAFAFSVFVATFPGDVADRIVTVTDEKGMARPVAHSFTRWLFQGTIDDVTGRRSSPFSNTLVLPDADLVDDERLAKMDALDESRADGHWPDDARRALARESINRFRGRNLRNAVFDRADLRRSDFTGADLVGASFRAARLQRSLFGCAVSSGQSPKYLGLDDDTGYRLRPICTRANRATFQNAFLDEIAVDGAQFWQADFSGARMRGALLRYGQFFDGLFEDADLQGTTICGSSFRGSQLRRAILNGSVIVGGNFRNAVFRKTQWHLTSLWQTKMELADFSDSSFSGARLFEVDLRGSLWMDTDIELVHMSLVHTYGAFLSARKATGALLDEIVVANQDVIVAGRAWVEPCLTFEPEDKRIGEDIASMASRRPNHAHPWLELKNAADKVTHTAGVARLLVNKFCPPADSNHVPRALARDSRLASVALKSIVLAPASSTANPCHGVAALAPLDRSLLLWKLRSLDASSDRN